MCDTSTASSARLALSGTIKKEPLTASKDCNTVAASGLFPIDRPDSKQAPLCERDYLRQLNLICSKCSQALRGSYIMVCSALYLTCLYISYVDSPRQKNLIEHLCVPFVLLSRSAGLVMKSQRRLLSFPLLHSFCHEMCSA